MIIPDVNLLLYAYDSTCPFHDRAGEWWKTCLSGNDAIGLTYPVIFSFIRIATSNRIYENPMPLEEASNHIASWCERSVARILEPDSDYVQRVLQLIQAAGSTGGNLVTDAQIAAIAVVHRAVIHTADYDFRRFPGLETFYPLEH